LFAAPTAAPSLTGVEDTDASAAAGGGGGRIAGIVIGLILLLLLIAGVLLWRKKNQDDVIGALKSHRRNTLAAMNNPSYDQVNAGTMGRNGSYAEAGPPANIGTDYIQPVQLPDDGSYSQTVAGYSTAVGGAGYSAVPPVAAAAAGGTRDGALMNSTYDAVDSNGPATGGTRGGAVANATYADASDPAATGNAGAAAWVGGGAGGGALYDEATTAGGGALYDEATGAGGGALYDEATGAGGGALYDEATLTIGAAVGGAALYDQAVSSGPVYDSASGAAPGRNRLQTDWSTGRGALALYDEAGAGSAGAPSDGLHGFDAHRLNLWLAFARRPAAETNFSRTDANALLQASPLGEGAFCFRPSSQGGATVVLCVLVEGKVANLRIDTASDGSVTVKDLASEPIYFQSMDHALAHFADPDAKPNNSAALIESAALPKAALHTFDRARLQAWLAFAKKPAAETGFSRGEANMWLQRSPIGAGAFCFRPSSQGGSIVLCVAVEGNVANLRLETASNGTVKVKDLAAEPIAFESFDHMLAHFADPNAAPNNSAPLVESVELPPSASEGGAPARPPKRGISRSGRQQSAYLGFAEEDTEL